MEVSIEPQPVSAKPCCGKVLIDFPSQRQANIVRDTLEVDAEVRVCVCVCARVCVCVCACLYACVVSICAHVPVSLRVFLW